MIGPSDTLIQAGNIRYRKMKSDNLFVAQGMVLSSGGACDYLRVRCPKLVRIRASAGSGETVAGDVMTERKSTQLWRWAAVVYAILVVVVSSWPGIKLPNIGEGDLDKLLHLLQYAVLGFLSARGWGPQRRDGGSGMATWLPALILLVFAAADEFHQKWIPGRLAEVGDWVADALGIAIGYLIGSMLNRVRAQSRRVEVSS